MDRATPPLGPRKFVVVVDDTPECRLALRFAANQAARRHGGGLVLLHVIPAPEFLQWEGVHSMMEAEARARAEELLQALCLEIHALCGVTPETHIEMGAKAGDIILSALSQDPDIFALVLGAAAGENPGPLVEFFSRHVAGQLPCPLILIPGTMDAAHVDTLV